MRITFITFILLTAVLRGYSQAADQGVGAIGLVVSDIERSEKFYTDILGFIPSGGFELSETWSKEAGMSNNRPFAVKIFKKVDHPSATMLKLAYFDKVAKKKWNSGIENLSGVNYLTFYYNDLKEVVARINKAEIPIVGHVDRDSYELVIVRDPDGVFIELIVQK